MNIKDISTGQRPREKLKREGVESLSDSELLALILRTGNKSLSAIDLARHVIEETGGIKSLSTYSLEKLEEINGIKLAKATTILASFELSKRSYSKIPVNYIIETSLDTFTIMNSILSNLKEENLYALFLDSNCALISRVQISKGSINAANFNGTLILKKALMFNAVGIILVHNHPSGNIVPSRADLKITNNFKESAKLINIVLFDHIIIAAGEYYSFLDNNQL